MQELPETPCQMLLNVPFQYCSGVICDYFCKFVSKVRWKSYKGSVCERQVMISIDGMHHRRLADDLRAVQARDSTHVRSVQGATAHRG